MGLARTGGGGTGEDLVVSVPRVNVARIWLRMWEERMLQIGGFWRSTLI